MTAKIAEIPDADLLDPANQHTGKPSYIVRDEEEQVYVAKAIKLWTDHRVASILSYLRAPEFPRCQGWSGSDVERERPNICSTLPEIFVSPKPSCGVYLMEYIGGRSLAELRTEQLPPEKIMGWILHLSKSLKDLSSILCQPFLHLDIKPGNIIIQDNGTPALIDFDCSLILDDFARQWIKVKRSTAGYAAPEVQLARPHANSDLYSLACTALSVLAGRPYKELSEVDIEAALSRLEADHRHLIRHWREEKPELRVTNGKTAEKSLLPSSCTTSTKHSVPLNADNGDSNVNMGIADSFQTLAQLTGVPFSSFPLLCRDQAQPVSIRVEYRFTVNPHAGE